MDAPVVLAFGGNALLPDPFRPERQTARARELARAIVLLREHSPGLALVHGNGPQVGMILLRVEATRADLPPDPLDVLVAETQGSIGYLLTRELGNALRREEGDACVTSILTQVVVRPDDPAFEQPEKPIGPFYPKREAWRLAEESGWRMREEVGKGWRRVVPSPRPVEVIEGASIARAVASGQVVVAGGGGGVPVARDSDGALTGVEAVIDKDRTASLLARSLDAGALVVLTGVPHVSRDFGTPREARIPELGLAEARASIAQGVFPKGSMEPKIEAACDYVEACGRPAWITDTASLSRALSGEGGTRIVP